MDSNHASPQAEPLGADQWLLVKDSLGDALECEGEQREEFLANLAQKDAALAQEVRRLLTAHSDAGTFLSESNIDWTSEAPLDKGATLGPYTVQGVLGEGGFSIVYSATQTSPIRREVAIKVIKPGMGSSQVLERFASEGQTLARMQHPGIATVLDSGCTPGGLSYFVMERVAGIPITTFCQRHKIDLHGRLDLFLQVCGAVQHAHQKGVVHRDLKPSNVLVAGTALQGQVKVIDFGIAKTLQPEGDELLLQTQIGVLLGTPVYMSPEQAAGDQDIDTRSDVYSLGVLLYELLSGHLPFEKDGKQVANLEELRRLIRDVEPPKPSTKVSQAIGGGKNDPAVTSTRMLRGDLDWIVMRAMEKERERRYPSASALAEDLERYLGHEPVTAGPPSSWYRMTKFARRNRGALAAMVGVVMALTSGLGFAIAGLHEANVQTKIAETAKVAESNARSEAEQALVIAQQQEQRATEAAAKESEALKATEAALSEAQRQTQLAQVAAEEEAKARQVAELSLEQAWASERFLETMLRSADPDTEEGDLTVRKVLDQASTDLATTQEFDAFPIVKARVHRIMASTYLNLGALDEADQHIGQCLTILEANVDPNDEAMLAALGMLCSLRYDQSRHMEIAELYEDLVKRCTEHLGPDHALTLDAQGRIAGMDFDMGNFGRGVTILEELIPRQKRVYGGVTDNVLANMGNLAIMYGAMGRTEESLATAQEGYDLSVERNGTDHQRSLNSAHALATVLGQQGKWKDAIEVLEDLVERRTRIEGPEHMGTIGSLNLLALAYHQDGQTELAEARYRECLEAHRRVLGSDHRQTIMCIHNLGMLLDQVGKKEQAEPLLLEAEKGFVQLRGASHPEALQARYHYASVVADRNRFAEIEPTYTQVVQEMFAVFGPKHPLTIEAAQHHAGFLRRYSDDLIAKGKPEEAEGLLLKVLANWNALEMKGFPRGLCQDFVKVYERLARSEEEKLWTERLDAAR